MRLEAAAVLDRLYEADAAQREAGLSRDQRTRNVDHETGRFLYLLALTTGARSIFEIGSSNGVLTIWLASAAQRLDGTVTGTEILPARADEANDNLLEAGLSDVARVLAGNAQEHARFAQRPFDLVFIDAEKEDYVDHFQAVIARVRPNGVILADNVISHDLSDYQDMLKAREDVDTVTLPIERGIEFTVKR